MTQRMLLDVYTYMRSAQINFNGCNICLDTKCFLPWCLMVDVTTGSGHKHRNQVLCHPRIVYSQSWRKGVKSSSSDGNLLFGITAFLEIRSTLIVSVLRVMLPADPPCEHQSCLCGSPEANKTQTLDAEKWCWYLISFPLHPFRGSEPVQLGFLCRLPFRVGNWICAPASHRTKP